MKISLQDLKWALNLARRESRYFRPVKSTNLKNYDAIMSELGEFNGSWVEDVDALDHEIKKREDKLKKIKLILK